MTDSPGPIVSVCIANYNGVAPHPECIDSVLVQGTISGRDHDVEIVHDDASTDAPLALLRDRYPDVRVIASDEDVGLCVEPVSKSTSCVICLLVCSVQ